MKAILLAVLCTLPLCAQTSDANMQALLSEVRLLRAALERAISIQPRISIVMQRIQMQEQKVARISGELQNARRQTVTWANEETKSTQTVQDLDLRISQEQDATRRKALEEQRNGLKGGFERIATYRQQSQQQEAEIAGTLRVEQAKLDELNDRLTALERSLDAK